MAITKDRKIGALLGVHAGDSLGAGVEFQDPDILDWKYPKGVREITGGGAFSWKPGDATDDTDLTKAVLDAYLYGEGDVTQSCAENFLKWYQGRPKDIGGATGRGIAAFRATGNAYKAGAGRDAEGNGSLMRCIPTALAVDGQKHRVWDAIHISAITHNSHVAVWACVAYVEMVHAILDGGTAEDASIAAFEGLGYAQGKAAKAAAWEVGKVIDLGWTTDLADLRRATVKRWERFYATNKPKTGYNAKTKKTHSYWTGQPEGPGGGHVLKGLRLAVASLQDKRSFEDILVDVIMLGKDTDTNGAIVGGMLGARLGAKAIPQRWTRKLQYGAYFRQAATHL